MTRPAPLLRVLAVLAAAGLGAACGGPRPPVNVLLVVLDTARADAFSAYGNGRAATPVFDHLADEGVVYTDARSTSAWTVPAHGSLFTGLYPSRHGAHGEHVFLDPEQITLAELLAPTHATAAFSENPQVSGGRGFTQGFDHFEETWREMHSASDVPATDERAVAWLAGRDRSRPFFVFVNFIAPHLPYAPPQPFQDAFVPPGLLPPDEVERLRHFDEWDARLYMTGQLSLSPAQVEALRGLYRAEVSFADARVGRLVEELRRERVLDRTLVAVVSDHGENITDHGLMEHQFCLYDTLLRVPFLLRLPGTFEGGERRAAPVQLVDVAPTVLEVAGVPRESWPPFEGVSLVGGNPPPDRPQVAEYMRPLAQRWRFQRVAPDFDFDPFERRLKAVVVGRMKLIRPETGAAELYDLAADPGEEHDLAAERPELVAELSHWLDAWAAARPAAGGTGPAGEKLDEETRRALRALGYLD